MLKVKSSPADVPTQSVYIIDNSGQPVVPRGSKVRVIISAISGSKVGAPKVSGPASIAVRNDITRLVDGQMPIGAMEVEFELSTTGGGKVTLEVPVKYPTSDNAETQEVIFLVE